MEPQTIYFRQNVDKALADAQLAEALTRTTHLLFERRRTALPAFAGYEEARDQAQALKDHTLEYLDYYLEEFERHAIASGAQVHWASSAAEACQIVVDLCRQHNAQVVTKSKSMLGEEIGLNEALDEAGLERVETDLGEHIIQLADEPPSHIVMPAMHLTEERVTELFAKHHAPRERRDVKELVYSARAELRDRYFAADVGISGANFLIAESGTTVTVTNEGNAELTTALPKVHIVTAGIEKVVPTFADTTLLLRLLARSALGTEITQYTTFYNGPRREGDSDGPEAFHIVLVDNRRSEMLASELRPMLRCIRCGACINTCPVYSAIGGHAYGWVYPGPMGAILTSALTSNKEAKDLPNACTLNGACSSVCPVRIPLTSLLRKLRSNQWQSHIGSPMVRFATQGWGWLARRPRLYHWATRWAVALLGPLGRRRGYFRWLPLTQGWTDHRDMTAPAGKTFQALWRERQRQGNGEPR